MRAAIIIFIVLVAALALYFIAVGTGHLQFGGFTPPPEKNGQPDKDAMGDWTPPSIASNLGDLVAPYAPHADFGTTSVSLATSGVRVLTAAPSKQTTQIAAFQVSGGGVAISYPCTYSDGTDCSETTCLCEPGALVTPLKILGCPAAFRSRVDGAGRCAATSKEKGSLVIYADASQVSLANLSPAKVGVSLK